MYDYYQLVKEVAEKYSKPILGGYYEKGNQDPFYLKWCDECKEINLWTYWQGRKKKKAEILLVGQDWETAWQDGLLRNDVSDVLSVEEGCSERYINAVSSPTDDVLKDLMISLGDKYNPFLPDNNYLFFTNLCLGYRDHGVSGGLKIKCLEDDVIFTEKLISIVEPKLIICLGKDTFDAFIKKTGINVVSKEKSFYKRLAAGTNYAMYKGIPVFGQAHPGRRGMINRVKFNPEKIEYTKQSAKDLLEADWSVK